VRRYGLVTFLCLLLVIGVGVGGAMWMARIPLPAVQEGAASVLLDGSGQVFAPQNSSMQSRQLKLTDVPQSLVDATLAIEDRRFFEHPGFDWRGIARAVKVNISQGQKSQGASTITQQLARNLFLSHEKTWRRKWHEAMYTLQLEHQWSKQNILTSYLSRIYYGHGAYGVEAAARTFFDKRARDLTLAECAMIAGIPKGPKYYSPLIDEQQAKKRQQQVLKAMVETGTLSAKEAEQAANERLTLRRGNFELASSAPYFSDFVRRQKTLTHGHVIHTTLDSDMQRQAEETSSRMLTKYPDLQIALVALDPRNGYIKAMIGGRNYRKSQFNRVLSGKRQPGSAFKPIVYLSALLHGATAVTKQRSEPAVFYFDKGKKTYEPKNFGGHYAYDWIDMRRAIAQSDNIYAVKTLLDVGPERVIDLARKLGIHSPMQPLPSLALGAFPISPLELAQAYGVLANDGFWNQATAITHITDHRGHTIYKHKPSQKQVVPSATVAVLTKMLEGVFAEGGTAHRVAHLLKRPVAGKTGTTNTDAWMVGYTPELVTVVWIGHDQGRQISTSETYMAAPIFATFTERALSHVPPKMFHLPDSVVSVYVEEQSGKLGGEGCGRQRLEHFIKGSEPAEFCAGVAEPETAPLPSVPLPDEQAIDQSWLEKLRVWWSEE
jgi:1A family penicillin-binding protein